MVSKVFVCGIDNSLFRLVGVTYNEETKRIVHINKTMMTEQAFARKNFPNVDNATLHPDTGTVTKKTGSFDRFAPNKHGARPYIILSKLVSDNGQKLGYKVADYDGKIQNFQIAVLTGYCKRVAANKGIPFQNAIYSGLDSKNEAIITAYKDAEILEEVVKVGHNKHVQPAPKINAAERQKNLEQGDKVFSDKQLILLNDLRLKGINPAIIANPEFTVEQMAALARGLERGVNVKPFASPEYSAKAMRFLIAEVKNKADISPLLNPKYNLQQLLQVACGRDSGVNLSKFADPKNSADEMAQIRMRLEMDLWGERKVTILRAWDTEKDKVERRVQQYIAKKEKMESEKKKSGKKGVGKTGVANAPVEVNSKGETVKRKITK